MNLIIAIDHGYGMIKTTNTSMITGVSTFDHEPFSLKRTLKIEGKYFVCGSARQFLVKNKTCNDNYYYLTLAAIAEELKFRQYTSAYINIFLAAGLPLTQYGREKDGFKAYLSRSLKSIDFEYEGIPYSVHIDDVFLYPQGYSAYAIRAEQYRNEASLILADCGSWTLDMMRIDNGIPNADSCRSMELGLIRCINEICEQIRRNLGYSVTEAQVEQVLQMKDSRLGKDARDLALKYGRYYVEKLLSALTECGLDVNTTPIVFMGGGATLIKNFAPSNIRAKYIEDIHANAKGYEQIARQVLCNAKTSI